MSEVNQDLNHLLSYLAKYPDQFRKSVREMLRASDEQSQEALEYIHKISNVQALKEMIQGFTETERLGWQSVVGKARSIKDPARAMKFIKERLIRSLIASGPMVDAEVWELSLSLKAHDVVKFCHTYKKEGGMLLNILDASFISKVIDSLPEDEAMALMSQAVECEMRTPQEANNLKNALLLFVGKQKQNSFQTKIFKSLASLEPSKEKLVYKHLLKSVSLEELAQAAASNCPLDVLEYVSTGFYQDILSTYPLNKKVKFLICLEEGLKDRMINSSAPQGSSARQMLEMEMKQIEEDSVELRRCHMQKNSITQDFLFFMREHLKNNPSLQSEIKVAAVDWLNGLKEDLGHFSPKIKAA